MRRFLALASAYLLATGLGFFFAVSSPYAGGRDTTVLVYWELPFGGGKQSEPRFGLRVDRDMYARYRDGSDEDVLRAFDMQFRDDGLHAARVLGLDLAPTLFGLSAGEDGDQLDDQFGQFGQVCAGQARIFCYLLALGGLGGIAYGIFVWVDDDDDGDGEADGADGDGDGDGGGGR